MHVGAGTLHSSISLLDASGSALLFYRLPSKKMIAGFSYLVGYIPWTHPSSHFFLRGYSRFTFIQIPSRYFFFPSFYLGYSTTPRSRRLPPRLPLSSCTWHQ